MRRKSFHDAKLLARSVPTTPVEMPKFSFHGAGLASWVCPAPGCGYTIPNNTRYPYHARSSHLKMHGLPTGKAGAKLDPSISKVVKKLRLKRIYDNQCHVVDLCNSMRHDYSHDLEARPQTPGHMQVFCKSCVRIGEFVRMTRSFCPVNLPKKCKRVVRASALASIRQNIKDARAELKYTRRNENIARTRLVTKSFQKKGPGFFQKVEGALNKYGSAGP